MTHDNSKARPDDPLAEVVLYDEVLECMDRVRSTFLPVFEHYSHDQDSAEANRAAASGTASASWGETAPRVSWQVPVCSQNLKWNVS